MLFVDLLPAIVIGISYGFLLFLVSVGLSVIFGLMRVINLSTGSFYVLGAYIGISIVQKTGNYLLALMAGGIVVAVIGFAIERLMLRYLFGKELEQVLLTLGLAYVFQDLARKIWGATPITLSLPSFLNQSVNVFNSSIPAYRLVLLLIGLVLSIIVWYIVERTMIGAYVRAGVDDAETLSTLGVNTSRVFTLVFIAGAFLSGIGGVLGAPVTGVAPGTDSDILLLALIIVVIGGLGSVTGAIAASLFLGVLDSLAKQFWPGISIVVLYLLMIIVLTLKPSGIYSKAKV